MSQSAQRALVLLTLLAKAESPMGLVEIANKAAIDKSTAARLLALFEDHQLARRNPISKKYTVGTGLVAIASAVHKRSDLGQVAGPYLVTLRDQTGETASLYLRNGRDRICIDGVESLHVIRRVAAVGESVALHEGPVGKAILAFLSERERDEILSVANLSRKQQEQVERQLSFVRSTGYLALVGDRTPGVAAIASPIFSATGVVGSITVAGPANRMTTDRMSNAIPHVVSAAKSISEHLRGQSPVGPPRC